MIDKETIANKIKEVLREELYYDGVLEMDTTMQHLGLDSIQIMQLFVYLEEAFQFEFVEDSIIANASSATINQLVDLVEQSLQKIETDS